MVITTTEQLHAEEEMWYQWCDGCNNPQKMWEMMQVYCDEEGKVDCSYMYEKLNNEIQYQVPLTIYLELRFELRQNDEANFEQT